MQTIDLNKFHRRICFYCKYSQRKRKIGLYCNVLDDKPNFKSFCPHFSLSIKKEEFYNRENLNQLRQIERTLKIFTLFFILAIIFFSPHLYLYILFVVLTIYFAAIQEKLYPHKIIAEANWFAFLYLLIFNKLYHKNNNSEQQKDSLIFQTLLILYNNKIANELLKEIKSGKLDFEIKKYHKKIALKEKIILLYFAAEFCLYPQNFSNTSEIFEIAEKLNLDKNITQAIIDNVKKYLQKENKQSKQDNFNRSYEKYTSPYLKYLRILGVNQNADFEEIKKAFRKLSLQYHPDKYVNKSETEKQFATKKYKEITEAYNFLKKIYSK